jgi:hypothetical protein
MLFVYSDHKIAVLILGEKHLPKALFLTRTLGLGRLFCFHNPMKGGEKDGKGTEREERRIRYF